MDGLGAPLREGAPSKEAENTRATAQCKRRAGLSSGGGAGVGLAEQAEQALAQPGIRGVLALAAAGLEQQGPELLAIDAGDFFQHGLHSVEALFQQPVAQLVQLPGAMGLALVPGV